MPSIIPGFEYDIFISYRQKDNKHDGWVTEFVDNLKGELESTFKEEISVYFDINPHDGLLETHDVDESLKEKLKCLVFIPIISRTYCDPKSFAWEHEFKAFVELASKDQFGLKVKLPNGNVASRVLPIRIHDLETADIKECESVLGSVLRGIEFIYIEPGVNKPLTSDDDERKNVNHTKYRIQINKVANAIKEIITAVEQYSPGHKQVLKEVFVPMSVSRKGHKTAIVAGSFIVMALIILGILFIPKMFKSTEIKKSIAVLPFVNLSNDPEQEYFSDGIVEAILDHLFKVGELKVISSQSTKRYRNTELSIKEIAKELGVASILEGSVQKIGSNVRITAQLIEAKTDIHLWSETYDKDLSDIFSIQTEVAQNVAKELKATLTLEETDLIKNSPSTTNQIAYDFYLRGNNYWSNYNSLLALNMYSKAIQEDSLFAAAYAKRALMHLYIWWSKLKEWQGHDLYGKEDIERGEHLNPDLLEIKFVKAVAYYWLNRDYDKSIRILNDLKTKAPNMADLYAFVSYNLRRQGRWEESVSEAKRSLQLDPFNANYMDNLLETYDLLHQYDKVIETSRQGLSLIPDYKEFNNTLFYAYLKKTADLNIALKESGYKEVDVLYERYYYKRQYDKLTEFVKRDTGDQGSGFNYLPQMYRIAKIYYLSGNKTLCRIYADSAITYLNEKLKEIPNDDRIYATLGKCNALRGNFKEAIACGKKAVDLKPFKLDAEVGAIRVQELMEIYLFTGNYDLALDKIELLLSVPSWLSIGDLIIDPIFDNLRSLPRFRKIIDSAHKNVSF